ncbi:Cof-type HAD-IIB family hydrolase [Breznakia pachnodae]|uniref:Cof subfamily protein (Haloacid dehalogenase superfamily) n=1 Tax=Breznakia pachnodae TaxID=265178 RepID=A0ABU0E442_9FIRM|nr:HAD family hydrolase [Breznakia pachnodae]MDQ0361463.1 Cof subfamily protein (haloacid dehalogenase superfamily) [Breznakia pachnodae]
MKILFFDIDGTLVNSNNRVSPKVRQAIKLARRKGHLAFLCTGRSHNYIDNILDVGFDGFITSAGAYIVYGSEVIDSSPLNPEVVKMVRNVFDEYDIAYDHECENVDYIKEKMISNIFHDDNDIAKHNRIQQFLRESNTLPMNQYNNEPVLKISYSCDNTMQLEKASEKLSDYFTIVVNPTFSNLSGDLMYNNTNKGTAICKLVDYLGLNMDDTIGFGDSMNDIEMLNICNESVVMGNTNDDVKQYATSICESVDDDGIYYELQRRKLI